MLALLAVASFFGYVSTRTSEFRYVRSGLISAPPTVIFPYLSNFRLGAEWSPYESRDPAMKRVFKGTEGAVGSMMEFDGNSDVGAGSLEITALTPGQKVELRQLMTRPVAADNKIVYSLTPEGNQTRFSWEMSGDGGFFTKLIGVFIDCEKMVAGDFENGIQKLKELA